ncbi:MAG: hypothetical protein QM831_45660 [Kofleriaceae bacterium]
MLDPWIIEEILKKEQEQRRDEERGRVELPVEPYREDDRPRVTPPQPAEGERGVMIIDI